MFQSINKPIVKGPNCIEQLVQKKNSKLEDFFDDENFLHYLNYNDRKCQLQFLKFLVNTKQIYKLIDYCIFPQRIKDNKISYDQKCKYAYYSSQVFYILKQNLVAHDTNTYLGYIFQYLDQKSDDIDSTQSSYFDQILSSIFTKQNVLPWLLIKDNQHQLVKFVEHISEQPIAQLLQDCLCSPIESDQKGVLIKIMIEKFDKDTEHDSQVIQNICSVLVTLLRLIEDEGDNFLQVYAKVLFQSKNLEIFFNKLFTCNDSYNMFYTAQLIIQIIKNFQAGELVAPQIHQYIGRLIDIIRSPTKDNVEIPTSYGKQIQSFGQGRMKILELFLQMFVVFDYQDDIMIKIAETDFYEIVLDLFFKYAWNTKLSFIVEGLIVQSINLNKDPITKCLLERVDIINKIVKNYRKSEIFIKYGKKDQNFKKGNVGCFTKIARQMNEQKSNVMLQRALQQNSKWKTFLQNKLQDLTKREEIEWTQKIEEFHALPKLEYMWSSYMDSSMPRSMQQNMGRGGDLMDVMERSKQSRNINVELDSKIIQKVPQTDVIINNPYNSKELLINTALYGCGDNNCQNPFCRNNSQFLKKYKNVGEFDVTKMTTPENVDAYRPCLKIQNQLNNAPKNKSVKLSQDFETKNYGLLAWIQQKDKKKGQVVLKSFQGLNQDKSLPYGIQIESINNKQINACKWSLELLEKNIYYIRNLEKGYILKAGIENLKDNKGNSFLKVGLDKQNQKDDTSQKWSLVFADEGIYNLKNISTNMYLCTIPSSTGQEVVLSNQLLKDLSFYQVCYV